MTDRRTAYRWTIQFDDPLMAAEVNQRVRDCLTNWISMYPKRFSDGWMTGSPLGILQVGLVVTAHDRWRCDRHARDFGTALAVCAQVRVALTHRPEQANLPPHTNRGYHAIKTIVDEVPSGT